LRSINAGSQPLRNLAMNPKFRTVGTPQALRQNLNTYPNMETFGGNNIVGTNLVTNPGMEAASGTVNVRTNLCLNPSFETNTTGWSPNTGTPTLAVDSAHAYVGTNGLKMTSTISSADIAALFAVNLNASTTYTLSYWVFSPNARTSQFDIAGTGWTPSGLGPVSVPASTWTRVTATFTTPSTSPGNSTFYLHNNGGPTTVGTSLWIDAVLLEATAFAGTYFDGATAAAGDFTYAWTGTANASTSIQKAPGLQSYIQSSTASVYQSAISPQFGTKCAGIMTRGGNGDGVYYADIGVTAGSPYTISAYVEITSSVPNFSIDFRWKDSGQVILSDSITELSSSLAVGSWVRISATAVAPAGAVFLQPMLRVYAAHTATTFYVDGMLIESSGSLNAYYDGATAAAGDFTYGWTGTANASSSNKLAPSVTGWTPRWFAQGAGVTYQSKTGVSGNCLRKLFTKGDPGSPQDVGINLTTNTAVTAGTIYTASIYFRCSIVQHFSIFVQWFDAGAVSLGVSTITDLGTVSANTWTRFSVTATAPANAVTATFIFGPYTSAVAMAAGTTMDFDQAMIEASPALSTYFDGATAAAGDFTYSWNGTVNASVSNQRAVIPTSSNKSISGTNAKFFVYQSKEVTGFPFSRWVAPANTGNSGWRVAGIASSGFDYTKVVTGGTYTMGFRYRAAGWPAATNMQTMIADGGSTNQVVAFDTAQTLSTGGWVDYRRTFTAARDMTVNSEIYISLPNTPDTVTDGVLDIADLFLVKGAYTGDPIDSANPSSTWDGAVDASTTIGYPPQLTDIAGKPALDLLSGNTGGVGIPVGAFDARTIYLVYEAMATGANYPNCGSYGIAASKGITFQFGPTGSTTMFPRFDFPSGSLNMGQNYAAGRAFVRHVLAFSFPTGLTPFQGMLDGGSDNPGVPSGGVGTGWDDGRATLTSGSDGKGIRMLVYYAEHNRATRIAISRYLGNKYGATVV